MRLTVNFNRQQLCRTVEIQNAPGNYSLPSKLEAVETAVAQCHPHSAFRFRRFPAHFRCMLQHCLAA
jgi:hypothetical protein